MHSICRVPVVKLLALAVLVAAGGLAAQSIDLPPQPLPLGNIAAGVPFSLNFGEGLDQIPTIPGFDFSINYAVSGSLPPGITFSPTGLLSGTPTTPGNYAFTFTIRYHIGFEGQSFDYTIPYQITLTVTGGTGPGVLLDSRGTSFNLTQGASTPSTNSISISNRTNAIKNFSATATTNTGGNWLTVSPATGFAPAFGATSVLISANPTGLAPGTYSGKVNIAISPTGESFDVPVTATVASTQQSIQVTQSGVRFQAVTGGAAPPSQTISVFNSGAGTLTFTAAASTVSGGSGWLSASASGSATSSASGSITVSANPAGLSPGDYYGTIQVTAPNAANSPQTITVVLSVFSPANSPGVQTSPTGLIFVGSAGGTVAGKPVILSNPNPQAITYSSTATYDTGANWLTITPASGTVTNTLSVVIRPNLTALTAGLYRADVTLKINEDNSSRRIAILLLVLPAGTTPPTGVSESKGSRAATCVPTKLLPLFTKLPAGFKTPVSWPTPIEATVIDDCGSPMVAGSVGASFSSGDPTLPLTSLRDGRWTGTWQPRNVVPQVTVTVKAQQSAPPLLGTESIGGGLQANPSVPSISAGGVVSAASILGQQPLAPGSFVSIYGSHLSTAPLQSLKLPLETDLGGTQAILAGRQLPLQFASDGQINAIVPFDVPVNTTLQLTVRQGGSVSGVEPVTVAAAQPAVFTRDLSGKGAGIIVGFRPDGTSQEVGQPVTAGDTIVIYCSGLGAVNPPVPAGSAAPSSTLSSTVNPVTVSIAGKDAPVSFAGLAPGFTGLYQINAQVPSGIAAGDAILLITAAGQQSAPVTVAIK